MNKEEKTLLDMKLLLAYYKDGNILDKCTMGFGFGDGRLVLDNEVMNILDNYEEKIYIEPLIKSIEKDKEIERLNNIINKLEKWLKNEHENGYEVYYIMAIQDVLDKLKELKGNNEKD